MDLKIETVDTESGYTAEEEAAQEKKIPISAEFRQFVKEKKKFFENRLKQFKKNTDPAAAKRKMKEYHRKMIIDIFVKVEVPAWLTDNEIYEQNEKAYENYAAAVMSFKERKFRKWLM